MAAKSRKALYLAAAAVALACSPAIASPAFAQGEADRPCDGDEALRAELERFTAELYRTVYPEATAPGVAVAVVRRNCVVFLDGLGYADLASRRRIDADSLFYIASSTKAFTGLAAQLLHMRGRIDLDGPIANYLSGVRLAPPLEPRHISLRQLLTHTHGIENWGPVVFRSAFTGDGSGRRLRALLASHPATDAGNRFRYGNIGYNAGGLVMQAATGHDWRRLVQDLVLRPLQLRSTTTRASRVPPGRLANPYLFDGRGFALLEQVKNDRNMHAAGGMFSSLRDMTRWLQSNMADGMIGNRRVFPATAIAEARRQWAQRDEPSHDEFALSGYGLGWDIGSYRGERLLQSQGGFSAYQTLVSYLPDRDLGIVVLTNEAGSGEDMMRTIAQYAFDAALGAPQARELWSGRMRQLPAMIARSRERISQDVERRAQRVSPPAGELAAYAGTYRNPDWGTFRVRVRGGRLQISAGALHSALEPFNVAEQQWRVEFQPARGETIRFAVSHGRAVSIDYGGAVFTRVR